MSILELVEKKMAPVKPAKDKDKSADKAASSSKPATTEPAVRETKKTAKTSDVASEAGSGGDSGSAEKKENFVQNLKKFFKRKGQE